MKIRRNNPSIVILGILLVVIYTLFFEKEQPEQPTDTNVLSEEYTSTPSAALAPQTISAGALVTKIVDGDTIHVTLNGQDETIRIIGINTPETVDPRKPVECFGKQASDKAHELLFGQTVLLETDDSQSMRDRYGRLLAYILLPGEIDYGKRMIEEGYAYEYTYDTPYRYQMDYKEAQRKAQEEMKGLWGEAVCD